MSSPPGFYGYQPNQGGFGAPPPPPGADTNMATSMPPAFGAPMPPPPGFAPAPPDAYPGVPAAPPAPQATWWNASDGTEMTANNNSNSNDPEVLRARAELLRAQARVMELQQLQQQQQQHTNYGDNEQEHEHEHERRGSPGRSLFVSAVAENEDATNELTGVPQDSFEVELGASPLWAIIPIAAFAVFLAGLIGVLVPGKMEAPTQYVLLGVGGGLTFVLQILGQMLFKKCYISKRHGDEYLYITVVTFSFPLVGYVSWKSQHPARECPYTVSHWTTTSTDKHGNVHTHHHCCMSVDDIGIGSYDEEDGQESGLNDALGRKPGHGWGEPDSNACLCCNTCYCGCN